MSESLSTKVPSTSLVALETVCITHKHFINGEATSFPDMAAGSINAVSYERDFALALGVSQCITQLRFLNAAARWNLMRHVGRWLSVLNSSCSFDIRLLDKTGLSVVSPVLGQETNVLPQYTGTTVQTIGRPGVGTGRNL